MSHPHFKDMDTKVVPELVTMLGLEFKSLDPVFMLTNLH